MLGHKRLCACLFAEGNCLFCGGLFCCYLLCGGLLCGGFFCLPLSCWRAFAVCLYAEGFFAASFAEGFCCCLFAEGLVCCPSATCGREGVQHLGRTTVGGRGNTLLSLLLFVFGFWVKGGSWGFAPAGGFCFAPSAAAEGVVFAASAEDLPLCDSGRERCAQVNIGCGVGAWLGRVTRATIRACGAFGVLFLAIY